MRTLFLAILSSSWIFALGGTVHASVVVTLDCDTCTVAPNPAVISVGETVEFACAANCSVGCRFFGLAEGITGPGIFDVTVAPGSSSTPLGPATVPDSSGGYSANELDLGQDCSAGVIGGGQLETPPASAPVPATSPWASIALASFLVLASLRALRRRRLA